MVGSFGQRYFQQIGRQLIDLVCSRPPLSPYFAVPSPGLHARHARDVQRVPPELARQPQEVGSLPATRIPGSPRPRHKTNPTVCVRRNPFEPGFRVERSVFLPFKRGFIRLLSLSLPGLLSAVPLPMTTYRGLFGSVWACCAWCHVTAPSGTPVLL